MLMGKIIPFSRCRRAAKRDRTVRDRDASQFRVIKFERDLSSEQIYELNKELLNAIRRGDLNKARRCIIRGANADGIFDLGGTMLSHAVVGDDVNMVRLLLDRGADKDLKDLYGRTALIFTVLYRSKNALELLIDRGADVNLVDLHGKTALDYAIDHGWKEGIAILRSAGGLTSWEISMGY